SSTISTWPATTTKNLPSRSPARNRDSPSRKRRRVVREHRLKSARVSSSNLGKATAFKSWSGTLGLRGGTGSVAQEWLGGCGDRQLFLIDVAPGPPLARLERGDDGVAGLVEVLGGVPVGGA